MNLLRRIENDINATNILYEWIGDKGVSVDVETAQARANVCIKCPLHSLKWTFESIVGNAIKRQLEIKKKLQLRVTGEKSLGVCTVCGCAMRLKVWIPIERIKPDTDEVDKYDKNCWLLNESE